LNGLLNAVVLTSLAAQLAEQTSPAFAEGTALNTRRFSIPIHSLKPKNTMANFVSAVKHHFQADVLKEFRKVLEGDLSGVLYTLGAQALVCKIAS
jgi:hypothetical protein